MRRAAEAQKLQGVREWALGLAIGLVGLGVGQAGMLDVRDFGARGDGRTKDTQAIQAAINACQPGDTLVFSSGVFLSGQLELKGDVTYRIDASATLLGSTNIADYPKIRPAYACYTRDAIQRSLLYAYAQTNITITGGGVMDGNGGAAEPDAAANNTVDKRVSGTRFYRCHRLQLAGITMRNFNNWGHLLDHCDTVLIDRAVLDNGIPNAHNQDGIDIQDSVNVRIQNSFIRGIDDALCLKSWSASGISNVVVDNCVILSPVHNAFKIGTYTVGPIRDIVITNCSLICPGVTMEQRLGNAIAVESMDGSDIDGVTVIGCRIRNHGTPFFIRLGNRDYDRQGRVGSIQNILFENIQMEGASPADDIGCAFSGLPGHPLRNVVVRDMEMGQWGGVSRVPNAADIPEKAADYPECGMFGVLPAYGFFVRHAEGVRFENVRIGWLHEDQRPWLTTINADVVTNNCRELGRVASPSGLVEYVEAESTTNLTAAEADLDVSASDGRFVALGGLDADKALSYGFRLTETSDVDLFVRARQPSGTTSGSAFKYRIDQSPWRSQPLYVSAVWSWSRLHADARHPLKGGSFANLKPGRHVLEIRPESAAELDLVRISCQRGAIETSAARATGPDAGVTTP